MYAMIPQRGRSVLSYIAEATTNQNTGSTRVREVVGMTNLDRNVRNRAWSTAEADPRCNNMWSVSSLNSNSYCTHVVDCTLCLNASLLFFFMFRWFDFYFTGTRTFSDIESSFWTSFGICWSNSNPRRWVEDWTRFSSNDEVSRKRKIGAGGCDVWQCDRVESFTAKRGAKLLQRASSLLWLAVSLVLSYEHLCWISLRYHRCLRILHFNTKMDKQLTLACFSTKFAHLWL